MSFIYFITKLLLRLYCIETVGNEATTSIFFLRIKTLICQSNMANMSRQTHFFSFKTWHTWLPSFLPLNGFLLLLDHVCKLLEYRSKFHNGALNILHCVCPALDVRVLLKEKQQNFRQTFCSNDRVVVLYLKQRVLHLYDWKYGILSINIQIPAHQWAEAARDFLESPCQWLRRPYSWTHPASGLSSLQRDTKQSTHTVAHARKGQVEIHTGIKTVAQYSS